MRIAAPVHIALLGALLATSMPALSSEGGGPPRVQAGGELLEGAWSGDSGEIAAFLGVPFARPPVGELRWRGPQPPRPRDGVQKATEFAPACMQGPHITQWYARVAVAFGHGPENVGKPNGISEDCLYLNVWTPGPGHGDGMPVMVWFHGGSNVGGWSYEPNYLGDRLAAKGVVVVSVAYRLGVFGFFSHPGLDNGPGQPVANFGWLDGEMALRWIKRHIGAFGGDPGNVTVMGESAGAGNISDFIVGEIEQGLYRRLVLQSSGGALTNRRSLAEEQETGRRLVSHLGIEATDQTPARLRSIPAEDLLEAAGEVLKGHYFDVVNDGLTFRKRPLEGFGSASIAQVDILIGTNADEWYMYLDEDTSDADLDQWLANNAFGGAAILRTLVAGEQNRRRALDRLITARRMLCPSHYMAARISAAGGRAWVYYFSRQRPGQGGARLGAYHGTEIGYVFDRHEYWQSTDAVDDALTEAVMDYWVQFARTGDPNVKGRPEWPMYRAARPQVLDLGERIGAMPPPDADLCLWLGPQREREQ
jgi:para-nitrobenzyl esterase